MHTRTDTAVRNIVSAGERNVARWQIVESEVADVLGRLAAKGRIAAFIRYEQRPASMHVPEDFTVMRVYNGRALRRRFAVSTSLTAKRVREGLFPRVKVLCFPLGTKPETIERRVMELFKR